MPILLSLRSDKSLHICSGARRFESANIYKSRARDDNSTPTEASLQLAHHTRSAFVYRRCIFLYVYLKSFHNLDELSVTDDVSPRHNLLLCLFA